MFKRPGAGADGCARAHGAHIVGLGGVIVLDQMVEETPLPNDRPGGVSLHHRVHLPAWGGRGGRVGTGSYSLFQVLTIFPLLSNR